MKIGAWEILQKPEVIKANRKLIILLRAGKRAIMLIRDLAMKND